VAVVVFNRFFLVIRFMHLVFSSNALAFALGILVKKLCLHCSGE
jgi:hypothetical protein